jgi:hypothetical protein
MAEPNTEHDTIDEDLLAALCRFDTPTICNALEIAAPERPRSTGYTRETLIAADPTLPPMVGYARTAMIRGVVGLSAGEKRRKSLEYYEYTAQGPGPTIIVVQDADAQPGTAAWWGEVHTALHQGLGSLGAITNTSWEGASPRVTRTSMSPMSAVRWTSSAWSPSTEA